MKNGRKYSVVVMVSILISLGMLAGVIAAINGADLPWLATTLPILASVYPAYMGANAAQKSVQAKSGLSAEQAAKSKAKEPQKSAERGWG